MPKGSVLGSFISIARAMERESRRQQKELFRQQKLLSKMAEIQQTEYEVSVYLNQLELISTIHKECGPKYNWSDVIKISPPIEPDKSDENEFRAKRNFENYYPGMIDKILKRVESKRERLLIKIAEAKQEDERIYENKISEYKNKFIEWETIKTLAEGIIRGDDKAYLEAIKQFDPFEELKEQNIDLNFKIVSDNKIVVDLNIQSESLIPRQIKTALKSGKLSIKPMPITKLNSLYQDYVCGCALRVARELSMLLPIEYILVNVFKELLDLSSGHMSTACVLSVLIPRETIDKLDFDLLDPSESMVNFKHNMVFNKTSGFSRIAQLLF